MSVTTDVPILTSTTAGNNVVIDYSANVTAADYYIMGSALLLMAGFGTLFNGVAIAVFIGHKELRTPTNNFIVALCACDLVMSAIGAPIPAYFAFRKTYITSSALCAVDAFAVYFLSCTAIYLLAAISVDRYLIIVKPLPTLVVTQKTANVSISLCFVFGFLWAGMPLLGWNGYSLEGIGIACSVTWDRKSAVFDSFIVVLFVACFLTPLLVMCFCYFSIYIKIRKIFRGTYIRTLKKHYAIENRMVKTVTVMISVFLISWTPYTIVSFTVAFGTRPQMTRLVETIPALIAKSCCIWNPVIYVLTNTQFRSCFLAWLPFMGQVDVNQQEDAPNDNNEMFNKNDNIPNDLLPENRKHSRLWRTGSNGNNGDSKHKNSWKKKSATVSTALQPSNATSCISINMNDQDKCPREPVHSSTSNGGHVLMLNPNFYFESTETDDTVDDKQTDQLCVTSGQSYIPNDGGKPHVTSHFRIRKFSPRIADHKDSPQTIPKHQGKENPYSRELHNLGASHDRLPLTGPSRKLKALSEPQLYCSHDTIYESAFEESPSRVNNGETKYGDDLTIRHSSERYEETPFYISRSKSHSDLITETWQI